MKILLLILNSLIIQFLPTSESNIDSSVNKSVSNNISDPQNFNSDIEVPITDVHIPSRFSTRTKLQPKWMQDYQISSVAHTCASASTVLLQCPIDHKKYDFHNYSPPSVVYACSITSGPIFKEPCSYNQASTDPRWVETMDKELNALVANNTWSLEPLPPG